MIASATPPEDALPVVREPDPRPELRRRGRHGANWFLALAGLSLLDMVILVWQQDAKLPVGLGVLRLADLLIRAASNVAPGVSPGTWWGVTLGTAVMGALVLILVGWHSRRGHLRVYAAGLLGYAADGLLCLLLSDWQGLLFHGIALCGLCHGWAAFRQLALVEQSLMFQDSPGEPWR